MNFPRRDGAGGIYFERPDGRVIPRFGYRLDDVRDDYAVDESPSTEVRETAAVYLARTIERGGGATSAAAQR